MEDQYLVSVIIPTFNRAAYLPEAIESIRNQGFTNIQIIVVDDGSTDNTREVIGRYGKKVTYLYQENQGPGPARNHGLSISTGKYIAFLDSDDLWLPNKLASELTLFEQRPEVEVIISDAEFWREGKLEFPSRFGVSYMRPIPEKPTPFRWETRGWAFGGGVCATCCMILKRSGLIKLEQPYFEPSISSYEDWYLEMKVYYHCKVLINPQIVAKVRRFSDDTRKDRPVPGTKRSLEHELVDVNNQIYVVEKFRERKGLPKYAENLSKVRGEELKELALKLTESITLKLLE